MYDIAFISHKKYGAYNPAIFSCRGRLRDDVHSNNPDSEDGFE